jgi:hypothetical protein
MESNPQNPTGYVRYYNSEGQPLNEYGYPGPASDTHLPLNPDEPGSGDEPLGGDSFELGFIATCGGVSA